MSISRVFFGTTKVQNLRRVALDANLLATLGIGIGDSVRVELDPKTSSIILTKEKSASHAGLRKLEMEKL